MSSFDLTRDWLRSVLRPYPARETLEAEVLRTLQRLPSLSVKTAAFTFDSGATALLLQLHGTLPITYRGAGYHIPVNIWFPHEYPRAPPLVFVVPTKDMGVRKGREVEPGGRVREDALASVWARGNASRNLDAVVGWLTEVFSAVPPVYAKPPEPARTASTASASSVSPSVGAVGHSAAPSRTASMSTNVNADGTPIIPARPQYAPPTPDVLPQYAPAQAATRATPTPPGASRSPVPVQSPSPAPGSPRVPPRPGQMPPVPSRPVVGPPQPMQPLSPVGTGGWSSQPYEYYGQQQQPQQPQSPTRAPPPQPQGYGYQSPPTGYEYQQPQAQPHQQQQQQQQQQPYQQYASPPPLAQYASPPQQQQQLQQPYPPQQAAYQPPTQPAPPAQPQPQPTQQRTVDLLSSPETSTSGMAGDDDAPPPLPTSKPPPPSLVHLHAILLPHLQTALPSVLHGLEEERRALAERHEDLSSGEPAVRDEMARLEAVRNVCEGVGGRLAPVVEKGSARVAELEERGDVSVDEVVCSISIVHNQLVDLVAEDNAISDTIYHVTRALDAERIDLDRYLKAVRSLAREQYMKRALIDRISEGMGGSAWRV